MKIQAAVVHMPGQSFQIEEVDLAPPKANEILVKIVASGICHTDVAAQNKEFPLQFPAVFGHEGSGIVEEVGRDVTQFKKGDKVVLSYAYCGYCDNCLNSYHYACDNFEMLNFGGVMPDGTKRLSQNGKEIANFFGQSSFATHAVVNENNAVKISDDSVDLALLGPLGCGFQTGAGTVLNKLRPSFGSSIAIFGCGPVGLSAVLASKITGCSKIIAVGSNLSRLNLARELGATHTFHRVKSSNIVDEIKNITNGGTDFSIDTSGQSEIIHEAFSSLRTLGTLAVVGISGEININCAELMGSGKSIVGVVEGASIPKVFIKKMIEYYQSGNFPIDRLITYYDFKDINKAFDDINNKKAIKAFLKMC